MPISIATAFTHFSNDLIAIVFSTWNAFNVTDEGGLFLFKYSEQIYLT